PFAPVPHQHVEQYLGTDELPKNDLITYMQKNADSSFLRHWKLTGTNKKTICYKFSLSGHFYFSVVTFTVINHKPV
uniref:FKBP3 basic tilted helix bundle domain-containing protein n=1 Tax=Paramormyrops kingsleyae TaxID=1676925 RepID=A0A3B3SSM0_9TELE